MSSSILFDIKLLPINEPAVEKVSSSVSTDSDADAQSFTILEPDVASPIPELENKNDVAQLLPIHAKDVAKSLESTSNNIAAQSCPVHILATVIQSSESPNSNSAAQLLPICVPTAAAPFPDSTISDNLVLSLNYLTLDSPTTNINSQSPGTPVSTPLPPKSPLYQSSGAKSSKSRPSLSFTPKRPSLNSIYTPIQSPIRRSSSTNFINASTLVGKPKVAVENTTVEPIRYTPESIAADYFKAELEVHQNLEKSSKLAKTVVILHDSCYGHRYSRPRASKAILNTIVERPERIHASILGISIAYVRLGERHSGGRYALNPENESATNIPIPFRIIKTTRSVALSSNTVTNVHGKKWMNELKVMCDDAETRLAMYGRELVLPEKERGVDKETPAHLHEGDLYLCSESLSAIEGALGAVCEGVDAVFHGTIDRKGPHRAFVVIRPPGHHCSASNPSGFCWVNNIHVGISHASLTHGLTHAAIIDFDLHHGDGSQTIAWEANKRAASAAKNALSWKKTSIGYFSLHDINSYPCEFGDEEKLKNASLCIENAHSQSIWNVHLEPWKTKAEFWKLYETKYSVLLKKTRIYLRAQTERLRSSGSSVKPKGAIFLSAGFDASEWESPGMQRHKVNVLTEFYARFTRDVVRIASEPETAVEGRVISVLEGGYSDKALCTGVLSHLSGMVAGNPTIISNDSIFKEVSHVNQKIDTNGIDTSEPTFALKAHEYNPDWWSLSCLEEIDTVQNPPKISESKNKRDGPTTFSSPTQSFISKVNSPVARRTTPGKMNIATQSPYLGSSVSVSASSLSPSVTSSLSSPPPEVSWSIAANELSKLLIPTSRQTTSYKPENLNAEAMRKKLIRVQKEDQLKILSRNNPPSENTQNNEKLGHMALRTRKPVKSVAESSREKEVKKSLTKNNQKKATSSSVVQLSKKIQDSPPESSSGAKVANLVMASTY